MPYYQCPKCKDVFDDSREGNLACPSCVFPVSPWKGDGNNPKLSSNKLLVIISSEIYSEQDVVVCKCGTFTVPGPGTCKVCGESNNSSALVVSPKKKKVLDWKKHFSQSAFAPKRREVRLGWPLKILGRIENIEINDNFVRGDSSQTQKYKPIEVKKCKLTKGARDVLIECMANRVLSEEPLEIRYQVCGSRKFNAKKDPIVIMTNGRFAHICDVLLNWGEHAKKLLAWHPENHDRCVFIFVQHEIFSTVCKLMKKANVFKFFEENGVAVVGWEFESFTNVRYGFGAMRRAVLTFFRNPKWDCFSGFWLLDDDTMIVPRTFDEAEGLTEGANPCIIGFTQGSTKRIKVEEAYKKYDVHQQNLQNYKPQRSSDTLQTIVLQQVVKYSGIREKGFPSFHQGFICSGEDVSFQRFLQDVGKIPVMLISGSIEKVELKNDVIVGGFVDQCVALNLALKSLNQTQNEQRRLLALSDLQYLNQIECTLADKHGKKKVGFGNLVKLIHGGCLENGNALNRSEGDILFLVVELLFCWTDDLAGRIPYPNVSGSRLLANTNEVLMMRGIDILRELIAINGFDIVNLILSFLDYEIASLAVHVLKSMD